MIIPDVIHIMSKTTVSTGGVLIDPHCQYQTGSLAQQNGSVYSCTLNQTNISNNNNKFYIMQVIHAGSYYVFVRYGRIGEVGVISNKQFSSLDQATGFFEKQFKAKTGNNWSQKNNFQRITGKYFLTEIDRVEDIKESESSSSEDDPVKLDPKIIKLLELITNQTYMKNTLTQLEIDTEKMPLGKISQTQIDKGYEILNEINNNLGDDHVLSALSSEYYTYIPINTGRRKPPLIDSKDLIGKNLNLLNELSQMIYGSKTVTKLGKKNTNNALIKTYEELGTTFYPLEKTDEMYQILVDYLKNSKAPTHNFNFSVEEIFELERPKEKEAYDIYSKYIKNKTLLFHGTRVSNMMGILKNGLVVDPSRLGINVSITGKMFGMGLYFANSCSKSINYCGYSYSDNIACLFVSEVALGNMLKKVHADSGLTAKNIPNGYHSTWGLGKSTIKQYDRYDDGTQVPVGKIAQNSTGKYDLLYDEFIVYHEEQVNLRYIIKLRVHNDDSDSD